MIPAGQFVTIDGIGGAGKTTIAHHVVALLQERDHRAVYTREPSDSALGTFLRTHFDTIEGHALACLVTADRLDHVAGVINPAVQAHTTVICDRYIAASMVLQPLDGVPTAYIEHLNAPARRPDLAVVLSVDAQTAWSRVSQRGSHGRFETSPDQFRAEHTAYQHVTTTLRQRSWNIHTIDTTAATITDVASRIVDLMDDRQHHGAQ